MWGVWKRRTSWDALGIWDSTNDDDPLGSRIHERKHVIINPKIYLTDQQFLMLQKRAIKMEITVEQMIEREVVALAVKEIVYNSACDGENGKR